ncbi:MAG TPA: tetratricopeptide repeat protein [Thermosynechococcaceae cyanobacterium]
MLGRSLSLCLLVGLLALLGTASALAGKLPSLANLSQRDAAMTVFPDYEQRNLIIHNYEVQVQQSPDSSIQLRLLAAQYLRRFREQADVEDLLRAEHAAQRSQAMQPSSEASLLLASTLLSQHRFREALQLVTETPQATAETVALQASIQMELGDYEAAHQLIQSLPTDAEHSGHSAIAARYLELTNHLDAARQLLNASVQQMDSFYTNSAEMRAWFHVRSGDLAFVAGDLAESERRYQEAIALFPQDIAARTGLARLYAAQQRWQAVLAAANEGIDRVPLVETLGYKADAQRALRDPQGAEETEALIEVVARLSKVQGIYDRALAVYYTEHSIHLPDALDIAQREVAVRDDIYAEDTLAWAAAANGDWQTAQRATQQATRYGTEDALLHFHRGMIALHCGDRADAQEQLRLALRLNPTFHHKYAAEARQTLTQLTQAVAPKPATPSLLTHVGQAS